MYKLYILLSCLYGIHYASGLNNANHFQFTSDLIPELGKAYYNKNLVMSPISVQAVLTLTAMGSSGETYEELQKVARLETYESKEAIGSDFKRFLNTLTSVTPQAVHMANRIYVDTKYSLKPSFNELATNNFGSGAESIDFFATQNAVNRINNWVSEQTNNKVQEIVTLSTIESDTAMVLVNAVYFKAPWKEQFATEETFDADFYLTPTEKIKVQMMHHEKIKVVYCESADLKVRAIQLPFENSDLNMVILLPNEIDGLSKLQSQMTFENIIKLNNTCTMDAVEVLLPKFKVNFGTSLKDILKNLGMKKSFSHVDLSDMLEPGHPPISISDVLHKAFISVDEGGAEAGASTAEPALARIARFTKNKFIVDHPFAFTIQDNNAVYFMSHIVHPTF